MRSIQTKIILMVSSIMLMIVLLLLVISTIRVNAMLNSDSDSIIISLSDYYADILNAKLLSTEQSVGTMYNYALKRAETYRNFLKDDDQRDRYTNDVSELAKSIAENTDGAMSVYFRYNPEDYGASNGLWYTVNLMDGTWEMSVPTDMSLYDKNDIQHVGWYYVPVANGAPMWMDPYFNANLGVDMISYIIPYYYGEYTVGIIGMDISMDVLKEAVSKVSLYDNGKAFLMDINGNIIYHEDYPTGRRSESIFKNDRDYFNGMLKLTPDVVNIYPDRDGTGQKLVIKELRNGMLLGVYVPIEEIQAPQKTLLMQQLVVSVLLFLIALLICLVISRTLVAPLKMLTTVAEDYANGNFDEQMSVKTKDEIGILSRSLQSMSTSLKQQIEKADAANKAKSSFLANMSHEIRTPINAVLGMNEMILREAKDEQILEYASDIQYAGRTLLSLINSILDFSKIEDGKMEIIPVSYDLASLINNLSNSISERAKEKGLYFIVDVDKTLPCVLKGDDVRLTQIIMNLLTNAVKYTEKGTVRLSVRNGGRSEDKIKLKVSVEDTGVGIRQEDMNRLYESFGRIEEKQNRNIEGTGLGMAIVTRLLEMMGSSLKVESIYGEGSNFSFECLQEIVDDSPIGNYEDRVRDEYKRGNRFGNYPQIRGAKILVVDDYEMNLKVAKNLLKLYGITPSMVFSGKEAIEMMKRDTYQIVFLDHMMPEMDGIETLEEIRKEGLAGEGTAFIAMTANAVSGVKEAYLGAGFDDYISKPVDIEILGELLFKYLPSDLIKYTQDDPGREDIESPSDQKGSKPSGSGNRLILEFEPKGRNSNAVSQDMKTELEKAGIDFEEGLKYSAGRTELYLELLKDFAEGSHARVNDLDRYLKGNDLKAYEILAHAIKSGCRTIGAKELSEAAKVLEDAAKRKDVEFISEKHQSFKMLYDDTASSVERVLDDRKGNKRS